MLLVPAWRWCLVGWLRGESFYAGRPTCYWREEVKDWVKELQPPSGGQSPSPLWATLRAWAGGLWPEPPAPFFEAERDWIKRPAEPASLPVLMELLEDREVNVRAYACAALSTLGPDAKPAVPLLTTLLRSPEKTDRRRAAWALQTMGPDARDAVPALMELLRTESDEMTSWVAGAALLSVNPETAARTDVE